MDIQVTINVLVELAALEAELSAAETTLRHHTQRTRDLRELLAEYEEDAALARRGDQDVNVRLHGKENEIKAAETRLMLKREQVVGCSDSRQYQALRREIANLERSITTLEDEALALLSEAEQAAGGRSEAEQDSVSRRASGQAEISDLDAEALQARAARDELNVEIDRLVGVLPEVVKRHVLRLRQNGGRAAVPVEGGACGGCFGQLPAQQAIDAGQGRKLVRCVNCARYVVHRPWH